MQENIINLIDENGVESQFEIILTLEAEGKEYAILMPVDEEEAEEALVFRIDQDEQGEILVPLEDDKVSCRPDRRQRTLFPAIVRQRRDTGIRRRRLAGFLPPDRRQEEHRRGCQRAQDAQVSWVSPTALDAATMARV